MFLAWICCVGVILHPAQTFTPGPHLYKAYRSSGYHKSPLLESLQCYNDYASYIRCSWKETSRLRVPVSLHYLDLDTYRESPCLPYQPPIHLTGGNSTFHCQYNTTMFAIGVEHAFFFRSPHLLLLSRVLNQSRQDKACLLLQLSQRVTERGGTVFRWGSCFPQLPLHHLTNYQLSYRRMNGHWRVVEMSDTAWKIEADSLVTDSWYEAKVRAQVGKGPWSEWSPLVKWKTEDVEISQRSNDVIILPAVSPGPTNLQCVLNGEMEVCCSWELQEELAQFVTYTLRYRPSHVIEYQYCVAPTVSTEPTESSLRFSCSFSLAPWPGELLVELTPTYVFRLFPAVEHIWLPRPSHVWVEEKDDYWKLSWTPPVTQGVPVTFEVCYWHTDTPGVEHCYNSSSVQFLIGQASLQSASCYAARVRAIIASSPFKGIPSEWSEQLEWTTPPAPWSMGVLVYVVSAACMVVLLLGLYHSFPACYRKFQLWIVSIPSPLKSKVLNMKGLSSRWLAIHKEVDQAPISSVQVLEDAKLPQACQELAVCGVWPMWLTYADDLGLYQCIAQQGWLAVPDSGGEHCNRLRENGPPVGLTHSFIGPSRFPLPEGLVINQLCAEDEPYVSPACQLMHTPCMLQYVEVPSAVTGPCLVAPTEGCLEPLKLQPLLDLDCPTYSPAPGPLHAAALSEV